MTTLNSQKSNAPQKMETEQVDLSPTAHCPKQKDTFKGWKASITKLQLSPFVVTLSLSLHHCSHLPGTKSFPARSSYSTLFNIY